MRISDWSSDVCSSDLQAGTLVGTEAQRLQHAVEMAALAAATLHGEAGRLVEGDDVVVAIEHGGLQGGRILCGDRRRRSSRTRGTRPGGCRPGGCRLDRKSTRLNSSH